MTAPLLDVEDLTSGTAVATGAGDPASTRSTCAIGRGETVGLVGESRIGQDSLGSRCSAGHRSCTPTVRFRRRGRHRAPSPVRRRLSRRMQVIFQDPFGSMNPTRTVGDTIVRACATAPAWHRAGQAAGGRGAGRGRAAESAAERYPRTSPRPVASDRIGRGPSPCRLHASATRPPEKCAGTSRRRTRAARPRPAPRPPAAWPAGATPAP